MNFEFVNFGDFADASLIDNGGVAFASATGNNSSATVTAGPGGSSAVSISDGETLTDVAGDAPDFSFDFSSLFDFG